MTPQPKTQFGANPSGPDLFKMVEVWDRLVEIAADDYPSTAPAILCGSYPCGRQGNTITVAFPAELQLEKVRRPALYDYIQDLMRCLSGCRTVVFDPQPPYREPVAPEITRSREEAKVSDGTSGECLRAQARTEALVTLRSRLIELLCDNKLPLSAIRQELDTLLTEAETLLSEEGRCS